MGSREHKVEQYLAERVKEIGGITRKWVSPGRTGVPDQIVLLKGKLYFIEVKTVGGKLSSDQKREHERLRDAGAMVSVVYGKEGVDNLIEVINDCVDDTGNKM